MMSLPTREDINVFDSLDERVACDHFLGKNLEEAEQLFRENSLYYQEDLMWMGPVAFRFYVTAAVRYLQSDFSEGDSDIINCFAGLIECRLQGEIQELVPIADQLAASCGEILECLEKYDLEPAIYGDVPDRYMALKEKLLTLKSG